MRRGRPPGNKAKPTHLKIIEGNPSHRPINKAEFIPDVSGPVPNPPDYLQPAEAAEWRRVAPELHVMGCLHAVVDQAALGAYCVAFARWREAEDMLAAQAEGDPLRGLVAITSRGAAQNPLIAISGRASVEMLKIMTDFGMTPTARARIGRDKGAPAKPDPFEALMDAQG